MRRLSFWPDGLRARLAAALLLALAAQFIGGEIIFEHIERARMERGRAQRLADWLSFADEFAGARPDAIERMNAMWRPDLALARCDAPPPLRPANADDIEVQQRIIAARPELAGHAVQARRDGYHLAGVMRLENGDCLAFRAEDYSRPRSQLSHYMASATLLVLCVILIAILFGRMIARPLAAIARSAERAGHEDFVSFPTEGPREVRQVAGALERMQARLLTHVRERLQSLAAMSHDLRTPLARLRLNASTVPDSETRLILEQDVEEMEAFVTSVLDYLRGDDPEQPQPADVASIMMTVVDELLDRGADISYSGPGRLEAMTRPLKLKRLIRNIAQNAVGHGGNARVLLDADPDLITITVSDDGPGIPEDKLDTVFEPFTRLDNSRSRSTGGAGLGLAIARQLSDRLGGSIRLDNRPEGGLVVTVTLPA